MFEDWDGEGDEPETWFALDEVCRPFKEMTTPV